MTRKDANSSPTMPSQGEVENRKRRGSSFWDVLQGRTLEGGLSVRVIRWILAVLVVVLVMIYNNYQGMMRIQEDI